MRISMLLLAGLVAAAPAAALETAAEIEACMEKNFPQRSSVQTIVLNSHDRIGAVTTMRAKIYWQKEANDRSRVVLRLSDPPDMRGSAILVLEKEKGQPDMFMYLPELQAVPGSGGRVKRITGRMMSGSMFGTDFSYEEFQRLQGIEGEDFVTTRLPDAEAVGRAAYVLETTYKGTAAEKPTVDRTVVFVDREHCVPLQMEFFERDQLRKRLAVDPARIVPDGARHVAHRLEISDVKDGTRTEMVVEEIELEADIPESVFTTRWLESQGAKSF